MNNNNANVLNKNSNNNLNQEDYSIIFSCVLDNEPFLEKLSKDLDILFKEKSDKIPEQIEVYKEKIDTKLKLIKKRIGDDNGDQEIAQFKFVDLNYLDKIECVVSLINVYEDFEKDVCKKEKNIKHIPGTFDIVIESIKKDIKNNKKKLNNHNKQDNKVQPVEEKFLKYIYGVLYHINDKKNKYSNTYIYTEVTSHKKKLNVLQKQKENNDIIIGFSKTHKLGTTIQFFDKLNSELEDKINEIKKEVPSEKNINKPEAKRKKKNNTLCC